MFYRAIWVKEDKIDKKSLLTLSVASFSSNFDADIAILRLSSSKTTDNCTKKA